MSPDLIGEGKLLQVALARGFSCRLPRLGEHREEDGCENGDDRYDDKQLDQGKPCDARPWSWHLVSFLFSSWLAPASLPTGRDTTEL